MRNIRPFVIVAAALSLLLIPFTAMKFTDEVNWTALDFITMGVMLVVTGIAIEMTLRIARTTLIKAAAVLAILVGFVMVWGALVHMGG